MRLPRGVRSVRARTTLVATAVVALVLVAAVAGLIYAVKRTAVRRIQAQAEAEVEAVADRLAARMSPQQALRPTSDPDLVGGNVFTHVAILDAEGDPVVGSGFFEIAGVADDGGGITVEGSAGSRSVGVRGSSELAMAQRSIEVDGRVLLVVAASPLAGAVRDIDTIVRASLVGGPLVIAFVGLVTWTATGQTLRPIERIRTEVEDLSSQTLDRRVPVPHTGDEVARLAETMNRMLSRLETASARQRQFVSDASHELRSPVASIRAELEVMLEHPATSDWRDVAIGVLDETGRIERIVEDMLLLARLDEDAASGVVGPVRLDDLVREVAARTVDVRGGVRVDVVVGADAGGTVGVDVDADVDGDPDARLLVRGRRDELVSVVRNLLDNAVRHAASRVVARVVATAAAPGSGAGATVVLTVDDDGSGIPPTDRERVFQRFTRLDDARSRSDGGVGLGLAVVERVVRRHDGSVTVLDSPSGGARFEVALPSAPGSAGSAEAV